MKEVIFSVVIFGLVYLLYFGLIISRKKKLDKFMDGAEVTYLKRRYRLKLNKVSPKMVANVVALANALIISSTCLIITVVENYVLKLMIAFVASVILILGVYHLIYLLFKKKES